MAELYRNKMAVLHRIVTSRQLTKNSTINKSVLISLHPQISNNIAAKVNFMNIFPHSTHVFAEFMQKLKHLKNLILNIL